MDGAGGHLLTSEAIAEAISFCLTLARLQAELVMKGDRFFGVWQPDAVPSGVAFTDVSAEMLAENPSCWTLEQGASWHGFAGLGARLLCARSDQGDTYHRCLARSGQLEDRGFGILRACR